MKQSCLYYRAFLSKKETVFFTGLLRSLEDHMVFDRCCNASRHEFEFFVVPAYKKKFESFMDYAQSKNFLYTWQYVSIK